HHRLELSALAEELFGVAARLAFDQHLGDAPEPAVVDLARDRLLKRDQPSQSLALFLFGDRFLPAERLGIGPGRVLEEERAVEPDFTYYLKCPLEVVFGLAGEADDDVRRKRQL